MGRACTVCSHANRLDIELARLRGASYRDIARQFGVSKDAASRHFNPQGQDEEPHTLKLLVKGSRAQEIADADRIIAEMIEVRDNIKRLCKKAEDDEDIRTALGGQNVLLKFYDLFARATKLIEHKRQVNVIISAPVLNAIVAALRPYPEASLAVDEALEPFDLDDDELEAIG